MAELMDDDIIAVFFAQVDDAIVEIEISFLAAGSPAGFLVANGDSFWI